MPVIISHLKRREYIFYCIYNIRIQTFFFRGTRKMRAASNKQQAASNKQQATGSKQQATGSKQQATGRQATKLSESGFIGLGDLQD
jgi:hypothetical protein